MLRQTADFLAELRALNRPPASPDPRAYRWLSDPCETCGRAPCMCPGNAATCRWYAWHARRRGKCTNCGGPAPDHYVCRTCAVVKVERGADWRAKCIREGRCQRCPAQAVDGKTACRRCLDARAAQARAQRRRARR